METRRAGSVDGDRSRSAGSERRASAGPPGRRPLRARPQRGGPPAGWRQRLGARLRAGTRSRTETRRSELGRFSEKFRLEEIISPQI